jgi:hypothetical protein
VKGRDVGTIRRMLIAMAFSIPGLLLALAAKPLVLGEGALFMGILFALAGPVVWLVAISLRKEEARPSGENEPGV